MHLKSRWTVLTVILANLLQAYPAQEPDGTIPGIFHVDGHLEPLFPDIGEDVMLNFVTNVRNRRDLSAQTHHIIQFQLNSMPQPVSIHLAKDSMSIVMKEESKVWTEEVDCIYSGVVPGKKGSAILSTCSASHGFSGHVILGSTHYTVEPSLKHYSNFNGKNSANDSSSEAHSVLHRVYRSADIIKAENKTAVADCLQAPPDLLQSALTAAKESSESPEEESPLASLSADGDISSVLADKSKGTSGKVSSKGSKVVDMALFLDKTLINQWTTKYPKDGKNKLKQYVINILTNMNLLYQQPSLMKAVDVSLRLVYIEFLTTTPLELQDTDNVDIYISSFCKWMSGKNRDGKSWDHALMLSGHDLTSKGSSAVAGVAYFKTICLQALSCSVGEGSSFQSSFIMTHEIGHSLGMSHDGSKDDGGVSSSCSEDKYIMSPTTGPGKSIWSSCSGENVKSLFNEGVKDERTKQYVKSHLTCLEQKSSLKNSKIDFNRKKGKLPGEVFDTTAQCHMSCGSHCSSYNNDATVCNDVKCKYQKGTSLWVRGSHSALEGTSCGNGKWCRNGNCVAKKKNSG